MQKNILIGRQKELAVLLGLLQTDEAELVSVIGRRRVGKTFLVQSAFGERIVFEITGIQNATNRQQLEHFATVLQLYSKSPVPVQTPRNWLDAFRMFILYLESTPSTEKRVIFFDELPWLAGHRSGFLEAFGFFWNSWAVKHPVVVVICGSAASWMIQKVVHNKGGLYNRITKRIHLRPFTLLETEQYLEKRNIHLERIQIAELYMAIGGIPHYLKEIVSGDSVAQQIDRICFDPDGPLFDEFLQLYPALFDDAERHIAIVRTLAGKASGLTRSELIAQTGISNGGGLTKTLEELAYSGFIGELKPFGKTKRETVFRLTDEYSLFYLRFIESFRKEGAGIWQSFQGTPAWQAWIGYAFEGLCQKHLAQIKNALGISGVFTTSSSFHHKGAEGMRGCQIDLVIDRDDRVINLCEMKWTLEEYIINKAYAAELRQKVALFKHYTGTKKQVFLTLISTFGLLKNEHGASIVSKSLLLDDLF